MTRLISTGNDGERYHYEFAKDKGFKKLILEFMQELGFGLDWDLLYLDMDYEMQDKEEVEIGRDLTKSKDLIENYKNKDFDVDLVYFDKTISLIIRTKKTKKLIELVEKHFKFKEEIIE